MTDAEFISYCEIHNQTPRALFSGEQFNRIARLAGEQPVATDGQWYSDKDEMHRLIRAVRRAEVVALGNEREGE